MFRVEPLNGTFGARVIGADFSRELDESVVAALAATIREHKVLVFPDQAGLGPREQLALAQRLGEPEYAKHPTHDDHPDALGVKVLHSTAREHQPGAAMSASDTWHTDGATREDTAWLSLLKAVDVPPVGRDTLFADMEAVYERLSPPMREFLGTLDALHSWGAQQPDAPPVQHPVVREDPETGRRWVYVNRLYTRKIVGLTDAESDSLLRYLFELVHAPECQLRVSWTPDTLVMWDNETTQHYLVLDVVYPRVMHRVMVRPDSRRRAA
jgi:taurine dioxygenase